jgi:ubiquinone/menaquinone biosynthesis C-methylase UbiE
MVMAGLEKRLLMSTAWRLLIQRALVPGLVRFGQLPPVADALEIGAGGGFAAEKLLDRLPGWRLTVTDYDGDMVELARAQLDRFSDRARVERADAVSLPYGDRSFDLVISILVWHHVEGWQKALAEAARVLRPRGWLLTVDLLHLFPSGPLRRLRLHGTYEFDQFRAALAVGGFTRWRVDPGPAWCLALAETAPGDERARASSRRL